MNALCRLLLAAILLTFPHTGMAQGQAVETGTGLICDTVEQLEQYIAVARETRSGEVALSRVNEAAGTHACGIVPVAYVRGDEVKQLDGPDGRMTVVSITVVAVMTGMGWMPVTALQQYTLFAAATKDREA